MREKLYHATSDDNYKLIQKDGFTEIKEYPVPLVINGKKRYTKNPGTLGYGLYGFDSETLAEQFGEEKIPNFKIHDFEIDVLEQEVLDFLNKEDRERYHSYKLFISKQPIYSGIERVYKNSDKQSSLEGALLEMYLRDIILKRYKVKTKCVRGMTSTQVKGSKGSFLANGCEYCIKCRSIIREA